jgi:hypothetical protein
LQEHAPRMGGVVRLAQHTLSSAGCYTTPTSPAVALHVPSTCVLPRIPVRSSGSSSSLPRPPSALQQANHALAAGVQVLRYDPQPQQQCPIDSCMHPFPRCTCCCHLCCSQLKAGTKAEDVPDNVIAQVAAVLRGSEHLEVSESGYQVGVAGR